MKVAIDRKTALIVVDVQKDFCPEGALPVPDGDKVVPILNQYIDKFLLAKAPIFLTRDWHPSNHVSFKEQGGIWPPHCVQNTEGAKFHPELNMPEGATIMSKATKPEQEAYSGFEGTDLARRLRELRVERVLIGGLATDYCVKNTVLDALGRGFEVYLLEDASRGVEVKKGDSERAVQEMLQKGAKKVFLSDVAVSEV